MNSRMQGARALALVMTLVLGCETDAGGNDISGPVNSPDPVSSAEGLCPTCGPSLGGDTGDFGGSETLCERASHPLPIGREAALALGFEVEELERRVAQPIDEPMRWVVSDTSGAGEPATGFARETRLTVRLRSMGSFQHIRVDPALCDEAGCRVGSTEHARELCPDRLELAVVAEVTTADGALQATLEGVAQQWRERARSEPPLRIYVRAQSDLRSVTGSLRLYPRAGAATYQTGLHLEASLQPAGSEGALYPSIRFEESNGLGHSYFPLFGRFPPPARRTCRRCGPTAIEEE